MHAHTASVKHLSVNEMHILPGTDVAVLPSSSKDEVEYIEVALSVYKLKHTIVRVLSTTSTCLAQLFDIVPIENEHTNHS